MIKVKDLIEILQKEDPERVVILQRDAEGNGGYSPFDCVFPVGYVKDNKWGGEVHHEKLTEELKKAGYTERDVCGNGIPALILAPVN